jgi:hypothetical protein
MPSPSLGIRLDAPSPSLLLAFQSRGVALAQLGPALSLNVALDLPPRRPERHRNDGPDDLRMIILISLDHKRSLSVMEVRPVGAPIQRFDWPLHRQQTIYQITPLARS